MKTRSTFKIGAGHSLALCLVSTCLLNGCVIAPPYHTESFPKKEVQPYARVREGKLPVETATTPGLNTSQLDTLVAVVLVPERETSGRLRSTAPACANDLSSLQNSIDQKLLQKGYRVVSRSDMAALLKEIGMQNSSLTTDENAIALGNMLNASGILIVLIPRGMPDSDGYYPVNSPDHASWIEATVEARLLDVGKAKLLWSGRQAVSGAFAPVQSRMEALIAIARNVVTPMPAKNHSSLQ